MVTALSQHYTTVKGTEAMVALPRCIMVGQCGSESAFQQALNSGEIAKITEKGKEFYVYQSLTVEKSQGVQQETTMQTRNALTEGTQVEGMTAFFEGFQPQLQPQMMGEHAVDTSALPQSSRGPFYLKFLF